MPEPSDERTHIDGAVNSESSDSSVHERIQSFMELYAYAMERRAGDLEQIEREVEEIDRQVESGELQALSDDSVMPRVWYQVVLNRCAVLRTCFPEMEASIDLLQEAVESASKRDTAGDVVRDLVGCFDMEWEPEDSREVTSSQMFDTLERATKVMDRFSYSDLSTLLREENTKIQRKA